MTHDRLQSMLATVQKDWQRFVQIELQSGIIPKSLTVVEQYYLCGADSVHLASALSLVPYCTASDSVIMVASDDELLRAADAAGLVTLNPAFSSLLG
jgi:hypothetical protein